MYVDLDKAKELGICPCNVFVDGTLAADCLAFDIEKGYAEVYVKDDKGDFIIVGDAISTERIDGAITYKVK